MDGLESNTEEKEAYSSEREGLWGQNVGIFKLYLGSPWVKQES